MSKKASTSNVPAKASGPIRSRAQRGLSELLSVWTKLKIHVGFLGGGCTLILLGLLLIVIRFTWDVEQAFLWILGLVALLIGVGLAVYGVGRLHVTADSASSESGELYDQYLVGLSFGLFGLSVVTVVGTAGLIFSGTLPPTGAEFDTFGGQPARTQPAGLSVSGFALAVVLLVSAALAVLGASFFVSNRMRDRRKEGKLFNSRKFWGGLWFRFGQAVLYTFVIFVLLWGYAPEPKADTGQTGLGHYKLLPIVGLFLGMFVKSGEALIVGLANRVLSAVSALIAPPATTSPPGPPTPPQHPKQPAPPQHPKQPAAPAKRKR